MKLEELMNADLIRSRIERAIKKAEEMAEQGVVGDKELYQNCDFGFDLEFDISDPDSDFKEELWISGGEDNEFNNYDEGYYWDYNFTTYVIYISEDVKCQFVIPIKYEIADSLFQAYKKDDQDEEDE